MSAKIISKEANVRLVIVNGRPYQSLAEGLAYNQCPNPAMYVMACFAKLEIGYTMDIPVKSLLGTVMIRIRKVGDEGFIQTK